MGADMYALTQADITFKNTTDVDKDILLTHQTTSHIDARRIGQCDTRLKLTPCKFKLPQALKLRLLRSTIHTQGFIGGTWLRNIDCQTRTHGQPNNVGQVILPLRIIIGELRKPGFELRRRRCDDPGVDFMNCALRGCRIFMLDDCTNMTVGIAHNATIPSRIG